MMRQGFTDHRPPRSDALVAGTKSRARRWRAAAFQSAKIAAGVLVAIDFAAVMVAGLTSDLLGLGHPERGSNHLAGTAIAAIAVLQGNAQFRLYDLNFTKLSWAMVGRAALGTTSAFAMLVVISWLARLPAANPSSWKIGLFLLSIVTVGIGRIAFGVTLARRFGGRLVSRNIVIVGAGPQGEMLAAELERDAVCSMRIVGVFDDRARGSDRRVPHRLLNRYRVIGTTAKLATFSRRVRVDEIFIALPWDSERRIREVLAAISVIPANVHLYPDAVRDSHVLQNLTHLDGMPVVTLASKSTSHWRRMAKWLVRKPSAEETRPQDSG